MVLPCSGLLIRCLPRRARGGRRRVHVARPAPCSTARRCRVGGPPTKTKSRCAAGAAEPRSSLSSQSSLSSRFSARSACAPVAVASTRWKSAASRASPIPVAASTIEPMALGRASTSRACWRRCGKAADARSAWRPAEAIRASRCSLTAAVAPRLRWRGRSEAGRRVRRAASRSLLRFGWHSRSRPEEDRSAHFRMACRTGLRPPAGAGITSLCALARPAAPGALARRGARRLSRRGPRRLRGLRSVAPPASSLSA